MIRVIVTDQETGAGIEWVGKKADGGPPFFIGGKNIKAVLIMIPFHLFIHREKYREADFWE